MSDNLESFLAHEAEAEPAPAEPTEPAAPEAAAPAAPAEQPPEQLDTKGEAIWREEREKRKELQRQVEQMNNRWAQMMERMQSPTAQPQAPQAQAPEKVEIPSFEDDPIGHLRAKNDLLEQQLGQMANVQTKQTAAVQHAQQFRQFQSTVDQLETQFAAEHTDYNDAVGFLYENVGRMAEAMGYTPDQRRQIVAQTAMDISTHAMQAGMNPAQMAYEAATRMGWNSQPDISGQPAPRRSAPTSLGAVAGSRTNTGTPSWDTISKMDDAEFDKFWKDMEKSARR